MNYDCTVCGRQYRYEESLFLHMKTDHGIDTGIRADNTSDSAIMVGNSADDVDVDIDIRGGNSSIDQLIIADAVKDVVNNGADI